VERISEDDVETQFGPFRLVCFEDHVHQDVHLALVRGDISAASVPLVRVQLTDTLRDLVGICAPQLGWPLHDAMARIAQEGEGIVVILRRHESPRELVDSVSTLSGRPLIPGDHRDGQESRVLRTYGIGAQILRNLGVRRMRVLSAPKQMYGLSGFGLEVVDYVKQ
jgi:3,4-dihydroxy 2-butanone 4-phosphate synthase / GTP cyclohydrolase II